MPRVTYVKKAQQRYETVVVRNEDGSPKRTPVIDKRTGQQRVTKRGPQFLTITREDREKPLAPYTCDHCHKPIDVGTPYKWIAPKSGPYGGRRMNRHQSCPTWEVWEYSNSLDARIAQIVHDATSQLGDETTEDDVQAVLDNAAEEIRSLASEKAEAADNIEDGFGHETSKSEELREQADALEGWADDVESADIPEPPDESEFVYDENGEELPDDTDVALDDRYDDTPQTYGEAMDAWRDEVATAVDDALQSPL